MNMPAKVCVFCCSNSYNKLELIHSSLEQNIELKVIPLPCSGKLDILYLMKAFESGADGATVMMCGNGECKYVEGNKRAKKRVEVVGEILDEVGMDKERVSIIQIGSGGIDQAFLDLRNFCVKITNLAEKEKESNKIEQRKDVITQKEAT
jgi:coenzyme F420-reducing hydrogenase delta subunit